MTRPIALLLGLRLLGQTQAVVPDKMLDCEGDYCLHGEAGGAIWIMDGTKGIGRWPTGAFATLTVGRFDKEGVIIHRVDLDGSRTAGMTATYTGTLTGRAWKAT